MPQPHTRHARPSGWDSYESQPSRSSEVRAAIAEDDPEPVRGKAIPWPSGKCKRNGGGAHSAVVQVRNDYFTARNGANCGWRLGWTYNRETGLRNIYYACWHETVCQLCGKILVHSMDKGSCPLAAEREDERERVAAEAAANRPPSRNNWRRRPVITGPQGYRRKRSKE